MSASMSALQRRLRNIVLRQSELDMVIPPEVVNDDFSQVIVEIAARDDVRTALEIGSSNGAGSTASLVAGLQPKQDKRLHCLELSIPRFEQLTARYADLSWVHCHNLPSVSLDKMPTADDVATFHANHPESPMHQVRLPEVLRWLRQDVEYVQRLGATETGITTARQDAGVDVFDLVLIDGSEFTGSAELDELYGARYVLLDDTTTYKNWSNMQRLSADPEYLLLAESPTCRNGFAAFQRTG